MKYARKLEAGGKFKLTIWPDHCLIGSDGHAIQDDIQNAVREWDIHNYTKTVKHIHKVRATTYLLQCAVSCALWRWQSQRDAQTASCTSDILAFYAMFYLYSLSVPGCRV